MAEKYDAGSSVQSKLAPPTENQPGGAAKGTATQKFKEKVQFAKAEQYGSRAVGGSVPSHPQLLRLLLRFSRILPPAAPPSTHMYSVLR